MSKFLRGLIIAACGALISVPALAAGDAANGEKVFKKCVACHAVGEGARNKVGPHLNDVFGRVAGGLEDFKYSKAMLAAGEAGLVWDEATMAEYFASPRTMIKGTRMAFAGLKKESEIVDVLAYLVGYSEVAASDQPAEQSSAGSAQETAEAASVAPAAPISSTRDGGVFGLGRVATAEEIAAWDIDVRPDGKGLPPGKGTVADGEPIYAEQCAFCHGDFGEGAGRWPVLAGGHDTLADERPEKTIGSYWPYLSTVYDYIRRAMPYGNARSLSDDDVYALTAYMLYLNDIVDDEDFELSNENFTEIRLPNEENFIPDGRAEEPHFAADREPCMKDCKPGTAEIVMRARILDVTPGDADDGGAGVGAVD